MADQNILILEDDHCRHDLFRRNLAGNNLVIVETASDAIRELQKGTWGWIFLDHDLGGQSMVESGPGTGYEVACWMEENPEYLKDAMVVIHSLNGTGAQKMQMAVKGSYRIPCAWAFTDLLSSWGEIKPVLDRTDRILKISLVI